MLKKDGTSLLTISSKQFPSTVLNISLINFGERECMSREIYNYVLFTCNPLGAGCELSVHETLRRHPWRLLDILFTFSLHPVSRVITEADLGPCTHLRWTFFVVIVNHWLFLQKAPSWVLDRPMGAPLRSYGVTMAWKVYGLSNLISTLIVWYLHCHYIIQLTWFHHWTKIRVF